MFRTVRLLAAAGVLLALFGSFASAGPFDGKWKITVAERNQLIELLVVNLTEKDGKVEIKVDGFNPMADVFEETKVSDIVKEKDTLAFTLKTKGPTFRVVAQQPAGDDAKSTRAIILIGDRAVQPLLLERTKNNDLEARKLEGADKVQEIAKADVAEQNKLFKELQDKAPSSLVTLNAANAMVIGRARQDAKAEEVKAAFDLLMTEAKGWGQPLVAARKLEIAQFLISAKKQPEMALALAQEVSKDLPAPASPDQVFRATQLLASALLANGKKAEAEKLDGILDQMFEQTNLSFEIKPFEGRKAKSSRVALVELFTGAQCPPCVSADIAFDACVKAFKPSDTIFLQYHLHIPGPDALTNPAAEGRQTYYGKDVRGTPAAFLNGKATAPLGGFKPDGEERFNSLRASIVKTLETPETAKLTVDVQRAGDKISIEARASDVASPDAELKLRLALIEDVVRYPGRNGQRMHHHVVREFPGGVEGLAVKEKTATQKATVSLTDLKAKLTKYLDEFGGEDQKPFANETKPVEFKKLKVVAFLQNDDTKEIVQAVQIDVPEAK